MTSKHPYQNPTYYGLFENKESKPFIRNYYCPNYDACLIDAARKNLILSCHNCSSRNDRVEFYATFERLKTFLR
jgi:hypothetical protein